MDASQKAHSLLRSLETALAAADYRDEVFELEEAAAVLSADAFTQVFFLRHVADQVGAMRERLGPPQGIDHRYLNVHSSRHYPIAGAHLAVRLLRRRLPFSMDDLAYILSRTAALELLTTRTAPYLELLLRHAERQIESQGPDERLREAAGRLANALSRIGNAPERKLRERFERLVGGPQGPQLSFDEPWAQQAAEDIEAGERSREAWLKIIAHCQASATASPSPAWLATAAGLLDTIGRTEFRRRVLGWLALVDRPRSVNSANPHLGPLWICEPNGDALKGLAWCLSTFEDAEVGRALAALAVSSYRKISGIGPRLVRVGNACVWALGAMPGREGLTRLAILRARVKFGTAQRLIEKALDTVAGRLGLPRDEVDELAVPTYSMSEVGVRRERLGDHTVELYASSSSPPALRWRKNGARPQKSVPAAVKGGFAAELKELKQAGRDIQRMVSAQKERLDRLFIEEQSWPLEVWRERYLNHPLVGILARRLIWRFVRPGLPNIDGVWLDGRLADREGIPITRLDDQSRVSIWHPIDCAPADVLAWRQWLEGREIRQPLKQAHREVYILTDAERQTRVYSNRFAAHILRQHQFNALCAVRGWKNKLRLLVDQDFPPASRSLLRWGLRAEYWIEGVGDEYGRDTNDTGTFHRVATDQVRFHVLDAPQLMAHASGGGYGPVRQQQAADPVPLVDVPPRVFSEIMRDVDLFVGVASVGNDPTWFDGGPEGRFRGYWSEYSFGELSQTSNTRKEVLERLVPRLVIADRCSFADRFLVVRGDLRTYKIHLGSGNILMEPNDQYLCVVKAPSREPAGRVFLPFDGDGTLSMILSKALLLADDRRIMDSTILSQIRGHG